MKDAEKKLKSKPTTRPVVYFKDFEKRFDELLTKNKTPRADTTISEPPTTTRSKGPDPLDCIERATDEKEKKKEKTDTESPKKKKKDAKPDRPPTPVFYENFAPPKKEKKGKLGTKKRTKSTNPEKPVNLLIEILHNHDKPKKKGLKDKKASNAGGKKKNSVSSSKRNISLPINL